MPLTCHSSTGTRLSFAANSGETRTVTMTPLINRKPTRRCPLGCDADECDVNMRVYFGKDAARSRTLAEINDGERKPRTAWILVGSQGRSRQLSTRSDIDLI